MYGECSVLSRIGTYMRAPGMVLALQRTYRNAQIKVCLCDRRVGKSNLLGLFSSNDQCVADTFSWTFCLFKTSHSHTLLPPRVFKLSNCYFNPIEIAYFKRPFFFSVCFYFLMLC